MSGASARRTSAMGRPGSSTSKTHVPSITSHAFFRPMSSQRLQAQRAGRSTTTVHTGGSVEGYSDAGSNTNRHSIGSNPRTGPALAVNPDRDLLPPSRGTQHTQPDTPDRALGDTSPSAWGTMRSMTDSVTPLQGRSVNKGVHLDGPDHYNSDEGPSPAPRKSPKSFRSSFLPGSRSTAQTKSNGPGHEKLSSSTSSPRSGPVKSQPHEEHQFGKNYQYFTGNTVFCFGGRFQNTRHQPINIVTGLCVLTPGILFFYYS